MHYNNTKPSQMSIDAPTRQNTAKTTLPQQNLPNLTPKKTKRIKQAQENFSLQQLPNSHCRSDTERHIFENALSTNDIVFLREQLPQPQPQMCTSSSSQHRHQILCRYNCNRRVHTLDNGHHTSTKTHRRNHHQNS